MCFLLLLRYLYLFGALLLYHKQLGEKMDERIFGWILAGFVGGIVGVLMTLRRKKNGM